MRLLIAVLLLSASTSAVAVDYSVGTAKPLRYSVPGVTAGCVSGGFAVKCTGYDSSKAGAIYLLTFSEGYTRQIEHAAFTPDPLKAVAGETPVKYRIWHHTGIDYVRVLDSRGKEGTYIFSTRDDDPKRQHAEKPYGPAPVAPTSPVSPVAPVTQ